MMIYRQEFGLLVVLSRKSITVKCKIRQDDDARRGVATDDSNDGSGNMLRGLQQEEQQ